MTVPFVAGPGGGGFMVIYNARTHTVTTIDGRERCPSPCTTNLFIDRTTGQPMNYTAASDQPLSTGVPSNVATWATAVRNFGRLSLSADLEPATGSGQVVPGYGFLLNDELTDFDFAPPSPGGDDPNLPAPGKEPRSSMGPSALVVAPKSR